MRATRERLAEDTGSEMVHGGGSHVDPAGSTELFFQDFFPAAQHHLAHRHPVLYGLMQPAWLAEECPEHRLLLGPLALRNPALLPVQLAGAAVGLWGVRRLCRPHHAYLRHSLLFFLCMNLRCAAAACRRATAGLPDPLFGVCGGASWVLRLLRPSLAWPPRSSVVCHTLTPRGTRLWGAAAAADVAFTGASSLCLVAFQVGRRAAAAASPLQTGALFQQEPLRSWFLSRPCVPLKAKWPLRQLHDAPAAPCSPQRCQQRPPTCASQRPGCPKPCIWARPWRPQRSRRSD